MATETAREKVLQDYRKKLLDHKELEARLKESEYFVNKGMSITFNNVELNVHQIGYGENHVRVFLLSQSTVRLEATVTGTGTGTRVSDCEKQAD